MKVFVLGHRGMLGHVVARYLAQQGADVLTTSARYTSDPRDPLVEAVRDSDCEWVVNALGRIKHKSTSSDELYRANTLFPLHLKNRLRPGQKLIHASTDCVFSGRQGQYESTAEKDAEDVYGFSKALAEGVAESSRCFVLRTSIIGPEIGSHFGLMAWFLSQSGPVKGYVNHWWNGLTTLEWAKLCLEIIQGVVRPVAPLLQTGFWPPIHKAEILELIGKTWGHAVAIQRVAAAESVDRSLKPDLERPGLPQQLEELKAWYDHR